MVFINCIRDFVDIDELYTNFYRCKNCDNEWVAEDAKYCSQCGEKIVWIFKEK